MLEMTLEKLQMVATCNMPHARCADDEDLKVMELLRSISRSQEVPTEACLQESPTSISCQMRLVRGGKGTISSLYRSAVGDDWYSYSETKASNGSMNLRNCIG